MPSRPLENATQDWTPVVLNKSAQQARSMNTELQKKLSKQIKCLLNIFQKN